MSMATACVSITLQLRANDVNNCSGIEDMKRSSPAGVDQRYYKDLLSVVPDECVSIPIILHCMVEQVRY